MNINNRQQQNNNRRRGRNNNNRQQNNNRSGFDYQNQIDNRARGNAAQMLEKYKKLAQDAQFNGDRVNAEYHLQFADHYFRVLADFRGRQEARQEQQGERRPREDNREDREDWQNYDEQGSSDGMDTDSVSQDDGDAEERAPREQQRESRPRRPERADRNERSDNNRSANRGPRRHHSEEKDDAPAGLDLAVLPPSIAISSNDSDADMEKPARKPRARRVKPVGDEAEAAE
ncbi:MAG: DUF4167 domain-containing protein [Sphingorhabdus sp.]|uniref:DUF4167 domain-containing protein n=1 Tax=Sphingorhabdus sp. TaxID=1902408 RepID=UPI00273EAF00|nr:DUF4167 domain-containing protein [Sphingorhabdus sp.]MDP4873067.1 DUF4167 domain-containing protein [Sphingorhabdus sp.]